VAVVTGNRPHHHVASACLGIRRGFTMAKDNDEQQSKEEKNDTPNPLVASFWQVSGNLRRQIVLP
jgi:hypothetical protein